MNKPDWLDLFLVFVPFSLLGAIFGDSIRKDALTKPQRVSAGLFSLALGPVAGLIAIRQFDITHVLETRFFQGIDHRAGLFNRHSPILRPVNDQERGAYLVGVVDRRRCLKPFAIGPPGS